MVLQTGRVLHYVQCSKVGITPDESYCSIDEEINHYKTQNAQLLDAVNRVRESNGSLSSELSETQQRLQALQTEFDDLEAVKNRLSLHPHTLVYSQRCLVSNVTDPCINTVILGSLATVFLALNLS